MPRAERPIDAEETELGTFAADLRRLREKAGKPAYRELASRAHYSAATLADAASGRKLPTLAVTLAYVGACDGDAEEWEKRWRLIASPPDATDDAPYVGLTAFQPQDADRFFGRENLTRKLEGLVAAKPFVGVFGPSGSGKSSLLRAGLVPRLGNALVFTPGALPADECAVRLAQLTGESAVSIRAELDHPAALGLLAKQHDVVLVVDQFEEVFTLCDAQQRDWFITALTSAPRAVVGVRADFYGHVCRHPELVEALDGAQLQVGPMTADELRRAITEPAHHVGATVETALVTRLVADVAGQAAALPLVQHALVETWHRRRGMTLTLAGYVEAGGVEHAIARTAEAVFSDLSEEQQTTAKQIFLRLIALGEGTEDTKRRASRSDLDAEVLERLTAARLVTLAEQHAELTHEALIGSWPRLREWIAEDRSALRVRHQLTEIAAGWDGHDRDLLYKGARLAQASELNQSELTELERAFLTASQSAGRRRVRRTRAVVSVLAVLVVLLAGTVVFAVDKAQEASRERDVAMIDSAASEVLLRYQFPIMQGDRARAMRTALAVRRLSLPGMYDNLVLNAYAAWEHKPLSEARSEVRFSKVEGGRFYKSAEESLIRLWDLRAGSSEPYATLPDDPLYLSEDDRRAVVATERGLELLDISNPALPRKLAAVPAHLNPTTSANGALDVIAGLVPLGDGKETVPRVWLFDPSGGIRELVIPGDKPALGLRLSRDGKTLAVARHAPGYKVTPLTRHLDTFVTDVWRLEGTEWRQAGEIVELQVANLPVEFSPDGRFLLLAKPQQGEVLAVDISKPADTWTGGRRLRLDSRELPRIEFSADSRRALVATNKTAHIWTLDRNDEGAHIFNTFIGSISSIDYVPSTDEFAVLTDSRWRWPLRTDVEQVVREWCGRPKAELTNKEWEEEFPGIERVPVC